MRKADIKPDRKHIACDYYIGNTHCIVCDDYCQTQTKDDIDTILERITKNALISLNSDAAINHSNKCPH